MWKDGHSPRGAKSGDLRLRLRRCAVFCEREPLSGAHHVGCLDASSSAVYGSRKLGRLGLLAGRILRLPL